MDLSNIIDNTAEGEVDYMGEVVHFTYKPNLVTSELLGRTDINVGDTLAMLITAWDITEKKGAKNVKLPINDKGFSKLPNQLITALFTAVLTGATSLGEAEAS
jgi:hypothetical protein